MRGKPLSSRTLPRCMSRCARARGRCSPQSRTAETIGWSGPPSCRWSGIPGGTGSGFEGLAGVSAGAALEHTNRDVVTTATRRNYRDATLPCVPRCVLGTRAVPTLVRLASKHAACAHTYMLDGTGFGVASGPDDAGPDESVKTFSQATPSMPLGRHGGVRHAIWEVQVRRRSTHLCSLTMTRWAGTEPSWVGTGPGELRDLEPPRPESTLHPPSHPQTQQSFHGDM